MAAEAGVERHPVSPAGPSHGTDPASDPGDLGDLDGRANGLSDLASRTGRRTDALFLDNLAGHLTPAFVLWLFEHGIIPLYTPLGASWLNMAESIQRIIERRALEGQHPQSPAEIIEWLEAATRGWNRQPTPFIWGGKRAARRSRSRQRRYALGGSGACTYRPIRRRKTELDKWLRANQVTH